MRPDNLNNWLPQLNENEVKQLEQMENMIPTEQTLP